MRGRTRHGACLPRTISPELFFRRGGGVFAGQEEEIVNIEHVSYL